MRGGRRADARRRREERERREKQGARRVQHEKEEEGQQMVRMWREGRKRKTESVQESGELD